jgi:hypothetical protein
MTALKQLMNVCKFVRIVQQLQQQNMLWFCCY